MPGGGVMIADELPEQMGDNQAPTGILEQGINFAAEAAASLADSFSKGIQWFEDAMMNHCLIPEIENAEAGFSALANSVIPEAEKARTGLATLNNNINEAQVGAGVMAGEGGAGFDINQVTQAFVGALDDAVTALVPGAEGPAETPEMIAQGMYYEGGVQEHTGGIEVSHKPMRLELGGAIDVNTMNEQMREEIRQAVNEEVLKILQRQGGNHEAIARSRLPVKE